MNEITQGIIRHLLTTLGGTLIAKGIATSATIDQATGALVTLIGIIWSIANKSKAAPVAEDKK